MTPQLKAFLDTIAWAEIGPKMLALSDNGFNVIVGSRPDKMLLFHDYSDHPRKYVKVGNIYSTAAGAFQILARIFDFYKAELHLPDFGKESQRAIATRMLKEVKVLQPIEDGLFDTAIHRARSRWASLPGAGDSQPERKIEDLRRVFVEAGGVIASA